MKASWKRSACIGAAFSIAACAIVVVGWRSVAAERATVERDARARLRATASEAAGIVASAVAQLQSRALTDPSAAIVRDGRFIDPPEPRRLARLRDSEGRDPVGDKRVEEAQRCEADPARIDAARSFYEEAALERSGAGDPAVRRLALFRLAALLRRGGRDDEAAAARATFVRLLDDESRASAEGLFARIESSPRDAGLQHDLLLALGAGDDAIVVGMLHDAGLDDAVAIAARRAELARIDALRPLLFALPGGFVHGEPAAESRAGAVASESGRLVAWATAESGEQRVLEAEGPALPPGVRLVFDASTPAPFITEGTATPPNPTPTIAESVAIGPVLPFMRAVASIEAATLEAEAVRRVRLVLGGLGLLLSLGVVLLLFTLRAVRRESEAAAARTAFVARVSHDLRTPLSVIRMYAETLAQGRATRPEEVREFAGVAAREAERLTALVARVLDFSRVTMHERAAPRTPVDLRELLQQAADDQTQGLAAAGMTLELVVSGEQLFVNGDREALRAACTNLLDNAIRHAPGGGRIDVAASVRGDEIEVRVADRGPGLPIGLEARIFEPFVRGPQARPGGSGLGLALVREVALAHGGRIDASQREGGGALFTLVLPRASDVARSPA